MRKWISLALCFGILGVGVGGADDVPILIKNPKGMVKIRVYGYMQITGLINENSQDTRVLTQCYAANLDPRVRELYSFALPGKIVHEFEYDPRVYNKGTIKFWLTSVDAKLDGKPVELRGVAEAALPTMPGTYEFAVPMNSIGGDLPATPIEPISDTNPSPVGLVPIK